MMMIDFGRSTDWVSLASAIRLNERGFTQKFIWYQS